jgi:hypothetical protein
VGEIDIRELIEEVDNQASPVVELLFRHCGATILKKFDHEGLDVDLSINDIFRERHEAVTNLNKHPLRGVRSVVLFVNVLQAICRKLAWGLVQQRNQMERTSQLALNKVCSVFGDVICRALVRQAATE